MDWIETTGRTVEEAKDAALDELGVDEEDAEFEVVGEAKSGLFGRLREEARVRARVRPTAPRPKEDRRDRRRRSGAKSAATGDEAPTDPAGSGGSGGTATATLDDVLERQPESVPAPEPGGRGQGRGRRGPSNGSDERAKVNSVDVPLDEQATVARDFVAGLVAELGLDGHVTTTIDTDEDVIEVTVEGEGLGLLIGPKGTTLLALQDLARSAVQQKTGAGNGRLNIDVSGYRAKRTEALVRFAWQVADKVKESGVNQALEPMSAMDRKVIHDALTDVEGVSTVSQGEDAARRVVIVAD